MAENSAIEWTDHTINFWHGCTKVGPGCDNCYAEAMSKRFRSDIWGVGKQRKKIKSAAANLLKINRKHPGDKVFISSMADLFDNEVPLAWFSEAWQTIAQCDQLEIQVVTKRITNVRKRLAALHLADKPWPNHVGLMITVCNQAEANRDIPRLLDLKHKMSIPWVGLSIEPLLGPMDLHIPKILTSGLPRPEGYKMMDENTKHDFAVKAARAIVLAQDECVDWVIAGGESGPAARPMHPDWVRSLRDQCASAGIPFFFKQWGEWIPWHFINLKQGMGWAAADQSKRLHVSKDGNTGGGSHIPGNYTMYRLGKKRAGHLLDGIEHRDFPEMGGGDEQPS